MRHIAFPLVAAMAFAFTACSNDPPPPDVAPMQPAPADGAMAPPTQPPMDNAMPPPVDPALPPNDSTNPVDPMAPPPATDGMDDAQNTSTPPRLRT